MGEILDLQELLQENRTLLCERNCYKSLHEKISVREELLKQEIQQLNARIRYLEKRLYGRKSEKNTSYSVNFEQPLNHFSSTSWYSYFRQKYCSKFMNCPLAVFNDL